VKSGALFGVRVLDLGLLLPSPFATRVLADLGADVLCVHPPQGDPGRELLPGMWRHLQAGKGATNVDLKTPEGLARLLDLVAESDVVMEGFRPGVADRLGIGFAASAARRPGLVYCSISGYGQSGPRSAMPAHDANVEASAGVFTGMLAAGEPPMTPYLPLADLSASMFAVTSVLAALLQRAQADTPLPAVHLDISMEEATLAFGLPRWGRYLADGSPVLAEDLVAYSPGAGVFATADGRHVALAAIEDPFWAALCRAIGRHDLARAPHDTYTGRSADRARLRAELARVVVTQESKKLLALLDSAGVPATLVRTADEVVEDAHLQARKALRRTASGVEVAHPVMWNGERPTPTTSLNRATWLIEPAVAT
jgi:CoA:oxalate CoA-transferase